MAYDADLAFELVKARLDRMHVDTQKEAYIKARIEGAAEELENNGIALTGSAADTLLLVDMTVWQYQSRDKAGGMPESLRLRRRERWMHGDP